MHLSIHPYTYQVVKCHDLKPVKTYARYNDAKAHCNRLNRARKARMYKVI